MFYVQMQIDLEVIINGLRMPSYLMHWPFPSVEENLHAEIFRSFGFSKTAGLVYQNASCFSFSMNHLAPINIYGSTITTFFLHSCFLGSVQSSIKA